MSEKRKANTNHCYFITLTVVGWIDVFTRKLYNQILISNLKYCQKNKGIEIFAYVIMSNHIHLIVRRDEGLLSDWLRDFKSYTAKKLIYEIENNPNEKRRDWLLYLFKYYAKFKSQNEIYTFWQKTSYPIELTNNFLFNQKRDYIHNNPVRAGIVMNPSDYIWSSANENSLIDLVEVNYL